MGHAVHPRVRISSRIATALALAFALAFLAAAQLSLKGVVDLNGKASNPFQHAGGRIIVFLFVRTDCPISNRYAPAIQAMSAEFKRNAQFYLVYPVRSETTEQIRNHLLEFGYKLAALRDPDGELVKAAQTKVTPEGAVFSPEGQLLYHGRIDDWYSEFGRSRAAPSTHELSSAIESAIAGKAVAVAAMPAVGCFLPDVK